MNQLTEEEVYEFVKHLYSDPENPNSRGWKELAEALGFTDREIQALSALKTQNGEFSPAEKLFELLCLKNVLIWDLSKNVFKIDPRHQLLIDIFNKTVLMGRENLKRRSLRDNNLFDVKKVTSHTTGMMIYDFRFLVLKMILIRGCCFLHL